MEINKKDRYILDLKEKVKLQDEKGRTQLNNAIYDTQIRCQLQIEDKYKDVTANFQAEVK